MSEKYYTVADLAEILRLSRSKIYKLAETKVLSYLKIGGSLRFSETQFKAFLKKCESQ
jgi:excisionase family DNA binding protein